MRVGSVLPKNLRRAPPRRTPINTPGMWSRPLSLHEAASRLARNIKVAGRVEELKDRGAERAGLSIANVTMRLVGIADKGEAKNDAPGLSVARLAMMDVAKLQGWLRDRHEITGKNDEPLQVVISPADARL
jgi:hypothetical protein